MLQKESLSIWQTTVGGVGIGNADLLVSPITAFFASRQCSGAAIRAAMDWAIKQARLKNPIISGFHSPLEQSVLKILQTASSPYIIVVARKFDPKRLPTTWLCSAQNGNAAIVGIENTAYRLTAELAAKRNNWIAQHSTKIVIGFASPKGALQKQIGQWSKDGKNIQFLMPN